MRVSLFVSCLVDQFWPNVGMATVDLLRHVGCEVTFDERQTCCGQPAYNSGYHTEARKLADDFLRIHGEAEALVLPSGSCTAMIHHMKDLFEEDDPRRADAKALSQRTHELSSFLVNVLGVVDVGARFDGRVSWHDACHGLRDLGIRSEPRELIRNVEGAELVESETSDSCCGFGGTFSVKHPDISVAMLDFKLQAVEHSEVDVLVSGDVSCLMQITGRLERRKSKVRTIHLAELLASRS